MSKKKKTSNPKIVQSTDILKKEPMDTASEKNIEEQVQEITNAIKNIDTETYFESKETVKEENKDKPNNQNKANSVKSNIFRLIMLAFVAMMLFIGSVMLSNKNLAQTPPSSSELTSEVSLEAERELNSTDESAATESQPAVVESELEAEPETPVRPMAQTTAVYKMLTSAVAGSQYGTVYAPDLGIDSPLYYGDSPEILMMNAVGQSTQTNQIGYASSHILCSYEPSVMAGILSMDIGSKFSIETEYGVYVYSVVSAKTGFVNADTGMVVDTAGNNLISLEDTTDTVYLYTDYDAVQKYVVKAVLYGAGG